MTLKLIVTAPALQDRKDIYFIGLEKWSPQIADDYDMLIEQALKDLCEDPNRLGAMPVTCRRDGLCHYPISNSKENVKVSIKKPSHHVFYFTIENESLVVARIMRSVAKRQIEGIKLGGSDPPPVK